jgi:lysophospholipase L1-like esterase
MNSSQQVEKPRRGIFFFSLKLLIVVILSVFVLAFGCEVYLRHVGFLQAQAPPYPCITGDPILNHVLVPNCEGIARADQIKTSKDVHSKTNSHGIRGHAPKNGFKRIVVIGDSYTEGFGLEESETFAARLEAALISQGTKDWEVLNGGTLGSSPVLYAKYFDRYFFNLHPEFVILNLDFTDFGDDVYFLTLATYDAKGRAIAFPGTEVMPGWTLDMVYSNRFALLNLIHQESNQWHLIRLREKAQPLMDRLVSEQPRLILDEDLKAINNEQCFKSIEMTAKSIMELKTRVEAAGGRLALHMYPSGYMVKSYPNQPQSISFVINWDQKRERDHSWDCDARQDVVKVIERFCQRQGIPFFDSFPTILNHPQKESLFFDHDAHWNAKGVQVVVNALATPILREITSKGNN